MFDDLVELGYRVGKNRVARLMRVRQLRARQFRHRRPRARGKASTLAPNLVRRQFRVEQLNTVWVADMTQIYTLEGWLYLAVVMDLCSRRIVGWATSDRPTARVVREAMCHALGTRLPQSGLVHHSDQGSQYGSIEFQRVLKRNGVRCSMSFQGTCADNSVAESFFSSLKRERTHGRQFYDSRRATAGVVRVYRGVLQSPQASFAYRRNESGEVRGINQASLTSCPQKRGNSPVRGARGYP
jgi:putative transposase